jgi:uncharacterized protein
LPAAPMTEDAPQVTPPTSERATPESSMEEIIASISRIIAEDNRAPHPPRTAPGLKSGILELTEAIEADGSVRKLAGPATAGAKPPVEEPPLAAAARIEPAAPHLDAGVAAKPEQPRENILSAAASEAAAAAFGRLAAAPRERRAEPELPIAAAGRTLEEIVHAALRPLLRAWLDDHLPEIVERLVRDEIQRVVREAGRR